MVCTLVDSLYLDFGVDWRKRYSYEPFRENLRTPHDINPNGGHVEIAQGSAQAKRVLGGEGGCWVRTQRHYYRASIVNLQQ